MTGIEAKLARHRARTDKYFRGRSDLQGACVRTHAIVSEIAHGFVGTVCGVLLFIGFCMVIGIISGLFIGFP